MLAKDCLSSQSDEDLLAAFLPIVTVHELVAEYGAVPKVLLNAYPDELERMAV